MKTSHSKPMLTQGLANLLSTKLHTARIPIIQCLTHNKRAHWTPLPRPRLAFTQYLHQDRILHTYLMVRIRISKNQSSRKWTMSIKRFRNQKDMRQISLPYKRLPTCERSFLKTFLSAGNVACVFKQVKIIENTWMSTSLTRSINSTKPNSKESSRNKARQSCST
jgi:hypothetical protein